MSDAALLRRIAGNHTWEWREWDNACRRLRALADWLEQPEVACLCCGSIMNKVAPYCAQCVPDGQ